MKYVKVLIPLLLTFGVSMFPMVKVGATPLTGETTDYFHSFDGNLDSVAIDMSSLGLGVVQTGTISFRLNLSKPAAQTYIFNFDTMIATQNFDLIVNFPLLQILGELPLFIHIFETGPIFGARPDLPEGNDQTLMFRSELTGGGVVETGSIFTGLVYSNFNNNTTIKNVNVGPGGSYNQSIKAGGDVNVTVNATLDLGKAKGLPPQLAPVVTGGAGTARIATIPVDEPSGISLVSFSLAVLAYFRRIRIYPASRRED